MRIELSVRKLPTRLTGGSITWQKLASAVKMSLFFESGPSLWQLARKRCDLKKKLRVTFVGEAGLDMGGLTKEWFLLLVRQIFHTDYGEMLWTAVAQLGVNAEKRTADGKS